MYNYKIFIKDFYKIEVNYKLILKTEIEFIITEIQRITREYFKEQTDKLNKMSIIEKNDPDIRVYNPMNKTQTASKHLLEKFRYE